MGTRLDDPPPKTAKADGTVPVPASGWVEWARNHGFSGLIGLAGALYTRWTKLNL